jgi:hypothetical protein
MILGKDINPKKQIYYLSALIIREIKNLNKGDAIDFLNLYNIMKSKEGISINLFTLSLDWLFLLGAIDKKGNKVIKCF